ncbi:Degenerin mec-10 [Nymphon striatum]|nr:Degenerin mec-10 [Nymphon striatum]
MACERCEDHEELRTFKRCSMFVWWIMCIIGFSFFFYHCYELISEYLKYPVVMNMELTTGSPMLFPAVSICSYSKYKKDNVLKSNYCTKYQDSNVCWVPPEVIHSRIPGFPSSPSFDYTPPKAVPPPTIMRFCKKGMSKKRPRPVEKFNRVAPAGPIPVENVNLAAPARPRPVENLKSAAPARPKQEDNFNISFTEQPRQYWETPDIEDNNRFKRDDSSDVPETTEYLIEKYLREIEQHTTVEERIGMGYSAEDLVARCMFMGQPCTSKNFTLKYDFKFGNCWTFEPRDDKGEAVHTIRSGPQFGLSLDVYAPANNRIKDLDSVSGFRIVVHDPEDLTFPESSGFDANIMSRMSIGVQELCHKYCLQKKIWDACGCLDPRLGYNMSVYDGPVCNIYDEKEICCLEDQLDSMASGIKCDCPVPCHFNLARIEVYFRTMDRVHQKSEQKYLLVDIFSSLGGEIGLWLGVSFITFHNILESFLLSLHERVYKTKSVKLNNNIFIEKSLNNLAYSGLSQNEKKGGTQGSKYNTANGNSGWPDKEPPLYDRNHFRPQFYEQIKDNGQNSRDGFYQRQHQEGNVLPQIKDFSNARSDQTLPKIINNIKPNPDLSGRVNNIPYDIVRDESKNKNKPINEQQDANKKKKKPSHVLENNVNSGNSVDRDSSFAAKYHKVPKNPDPNVPVNHSRKGKMPVKTIEKETGKQQDIKVTSGNAGDGTTEAKLASNAHKNGAVKPKSKTITNEKNEEPLTKQGEQNKNLNSVDNPKQTGDEINQDTNEEPLTKQGEQNKNEPPVGNNPLINGDKINQDTNEEPLTKQGEQNKNEPPVGNNPLTNGVKINPDINEELLTKQGEQNKNEPSVGNNPLTNGDKINQDTNEEPLTKQGEQNKNEPSVGNNPLTNGDKINQDTNEEPLTKQGEQNKNEPPVGNNPLTNGDKINQDTNEEPLTKQGEQNKNEPPVGNNPLTNGDKINQDTNEEPLTKKGEQNKNEPPVGNNPLTNGDKINQDTNEEPLTKQGEQNKNEHSVANLENCGACLKRKRNLRFYFNDELTLEPQREIGKTKEKMRSPVFIEINDYEDQGNSHFFVYFISIVVLCIISYLVFHNKKKLIALVVEGRQGYRPRRRSMNKSYHRLENVDDALSDSKTASLSTTTNVVY